MHNLKIVLGGVQFATTLISVHFDRADTVWDEKIIENDVQVDYVSANKAAEEL